MRRPTSGRTAAYAVVVLALSLLTLWTTWGSGPAVAADGATITIEKGGDRTGAQTVAGLPGAVFDLYAGVSTGSPSGTPAASCTTGADGTCTVTVPARTGNNQGYWVVERTAPTGFSIISQLNTGGGTTTPTAYNRYFIGNVHANQSYQVPTPSTGNTNATARSDYWADIRDNPSLPDHCGLNIALLVDVSGSIASSLPTVKDAANGFVDALTGTPSRIAVYSFATNADALLGPTAVPDSSSAQTVKDVVNGLTAGGGTNWDAGLWAVAAATTTFDAVVMLTDGNPTFYGPNADGPGNFTRFREVENGIFSANAVKALGTKVVAVGVGAGISGSPLNLQAVSGPVAGTDYVQTGYDQLAAVFRAIALRTCSGSVSVVKRVLPPTGTIDDAVPAGDWVFSTTTAGVTPTSGTTAGDSGAVSFTADLDGAAALPVTLTETPQAGYSLVQVGGLNATCASDGSSVPVTNSGATGFTVSALRNAIVTCTVYNRAPTPPATVTVHKKWIIQGTAYDEPNQPDEFQSALTLTGQTDPVWGQTYGGYLAGDVVTIGENVNLDLLPPGCSLTATQGDVGVETLVAGDNVFTVTNTVTCETKLTLLKSVINPFTAAEPADSWTLTAYAEGGSPVFSGTTGVQQEVEPRTRYLLGETTVPGYVQDRGPNAVIVPPATGSWSCSLRQRDGTLGPEYDGLNGGVTVQLGQLAECTAVNQAQPAKLTLRKQVDNTGGGSAEPGSWLLQAVPDGDASSISGRDGEPAVTGAEAVPGIAYALGESGGPTDYLPGPVTCVLTGTDTVVDTPGDVLTPAIGQDVTCTFTNVYQPTSPTPSASSGEPSPSASGQPTPTASGTTPPPIPVTGTPVGRVAAYAVGLTALGAGLLLAARIRRRDRDPSPR
ncbi:MAG: VWA domain-containing protein [Hamadaea sp.]|nr:VWA domain-containing protein [Hamadaea sp.]NUT21713.1 VWA domain-containing protein [Hamadaea sp.]